MSGLRMALQVARWEFTRFFKIRDVITTVILFVLAGGAVVGVKKLLEATDEDGPARVAVLRGELLPFRMSAGSSGVASSSKSVSASLQTPGQGVLGAQSL